MSDPTTLPHLVRFGIYEVDLRSGELRRNGQKIKIQEQPFHVLAMLLEHPGEIVTREELQKALWSTDTFVDFEHGLNKAINKIREALDDSADNPRFVETLARRGYRFIYPVAPVSPPAAAVAPVYDRRSLEKPAIIDRRYSMARLVALAAGLILVTFAVFLALNVVGLRGRILHRAASTKSTLPPLRAVPFTSFPGREEDARFSPDGNQIAFAWDGEKEDNWDIYVKLIGEEKPLRLTTDPGVDRSPAWSPDGRYIAFHRHTEHEDAIYVVPALGGPERKLHSSKFAGTRLLALDWSPDGKYLAYVDRRPGQQGASIFLLEVDNPDDTRALTSPSGPHTVDYFPRFSPDGARVAFIRLFSRGGATDVHVVPVRGGEPKRFTFDNVHVLGLDWTPDGAYIVFSSERLGDARLWKVSASRGELEPLSVGQGGALWPSLSRDGRRLAYTQVSADTNIWQYEVSRAPGRSATPTKLIASTQLDQSQQYSSDGKRIVFASTRSGSPEIWVCDSDGTAPLQLTFFGGPMTGTPRWAPDDRQIAFDSEPEGHGDIYVVSAEGGRSRRLTTESYNDNVPSWSRDGKFIYFASDRTGTWQVWKMPAEGGRAVQVTKQGGFAAFESLDGKTLYYAKGQDRPGLWKVPVAGGEETSVLEQLDAGHWGYWGLTAHGIYFYNAGTKAIEFFSFVTRKETQIAKPAKEPIRFNPGFSVSPDGRWILYAQVDQFTSDIMLVENFRW